MSILYAVVARGNVIMASGPEPNQGLNAALKGVFSKITSGRLHQIDQGKQVVRIITDNGMNFACLADSSVDSKRQVSFLEELQRQWVRKYGQGTQNFAENQKNGEFGPTIQSSLSAFNSEQGHKIAIIKENIMQAQEAMTKNLEEALKRGDSLEAMENKANELNNHAQQFERSTKDLKRKMCFQKYRWYFLGALIVVVLIWLISSFICGFDYHKC